MAQILKLYDITDVELTSANASGKNPGLYSITLSAGGSQTVYFLFDITGKISTEMTNVFFYTKSAVTLAGTLEYYVEGTWALDASWKGCKPYDFSLDSTDSQRMNGLYPLKELHYGGPKRLKITASDDCTIFCKVVSI